MFDLLKDFTHVAWDFDETLVDHDASPAMWDFIRRNPYGQMHSIITMRSHGMERSIFPILFSEGSGLQREDFAHVLNVSDALYESYSRSRFAKIDTDDHEYTEWKGKMCREIGAEVLVDDMEERAVSKRGCIVHGIIHIHPNQLVSR